MQTLGLLRETKHIDVALLVTASTFSMRRLAIFGHHVPSVEMAKLADARDLKSRVQKGTYRFDSGPGHQVTLAARIISV